MPFTHKPTINWNQIRNIPTAINKVASFGYDTINNVRSNWNADDPNDDSFIENKPIVPTSTQELPELNNLYYTEQRVQNHPFVSGSVTVHHDIHDAGSGAIIKNDERFKLNNIEANATQNPTGDEIKALYESQPNTNVYTDNDKNKLLSVEHGAEVNSVNTVAGKTGNIILSKDDVGLNNVPNIETSITVTANSVVQRDSAGDIHARLLRSQYNATNSAVNYIMTQIDTANNNYIRPTTPSQFRSSITDSYYLGKSATASDSNKWQGWQRDAYLNQSVCTTANPTFGNNLNLVGTSPTIKLHDTNSRIFWIHNNSGSIYILSNKGSGNSWVGTYPARWNDITEEVTFWGATVWTAANFNPNAINAQSLNNLTSTQFLRADTSDSISGNLTVTGVIFANEIRDRTGTQLVLNCGESEGKVTGQTGELVYINAEGGLAVNTPTVNNWGSGYDVNTAIIKGNSILLSGQQVWHSGNLPVAIGATANHIVQRSSSGHIYGNYGMFQHVSIAGSNDVTTNITKFYVEINNDHYVRQATITTVKNLLGRVNDSAALGGVTSNNFMRVDISDTFYGTLYQASSNIPAIVCKNSSYPGAQLHIGGWNSSNANNISRIRNSNHNLHIDCAANGGLYFNWYTDGAIYYSSTLYFYNKTRSVRLGDIGTDTDNRWLRINQLTNKNVYTPRMFRADGGIQVDGKWIVSSTGDTLYEGGTALSSKYLRKDIDGTSTGRIVFTKSQSSNLNTNNGGYGGLELRATGSGSTAKAAFMCFHRPGAYAVYFGLGTNNQLEIGGWSMGSTSHKIWHAGNDGSGSGLDADLWDGWQRSNYLNQAVKTNSTPTFHSVYTGSWFRSTGKSGWYSQNYGGGIYMVDSTWVRIYNNKQFYISSPVAATSTTGNAAFGCPGVRIGAGNIHTSSLISSGTVKTGHITMFGSPTYIDFNNTNNVDRNARIICEDGNTTDNSGTLKIEAGSIWFQSLLNNENSIFYFNGSHNLNEMWGFNCYSNNYFYLQAFNKNGSFKSNILRVNNNKIDFLKPVYNSSSKKNKTELKKIKDENPLDKLKTLIPIIYHYNDDILKKAHPGFFVEDIPEELYINSDDGKSLNYSQLTAWIVGAIQELDQKISQLSII